MNNQNNKTDYKQILKKYAVFALIGLVFIGSMWFIFAPSATEKEKEQTGFNTNIPDPANDGIISDKKDAYEQAQMKQRQNDKMQSLQDYAFMLGESNNSKNELQLTDNKPTAKENIGTSVSAYQDINRTLGNFYEKPKDDPENEKMKRRLEELEERMQEKENSENAMNEQIALMEKSYEIASRYMPQNQEGNNSLKNKIDNYSANGRDAKVMPIRNIQNQTVSALQQEYSQSELFDMYDQIRNTGFNTLGGKLAVSEKNTISAVVQGDQTLIDGQSIRLRLTEPLMAGTVFIPENTMITGQAKVQGERLNVLVSSIEYQGAILPVELSAYDSDGQKGIYIPGSLELNAIKEIAANMGQSMGTSISITKNAGSQVAADLTRGLIQGTSQYMQKKIREVKVNVKSGYRIMLMPKQ